MKKTIKPIVDVKWILKHFETRIGEVNIKGKFTVVKMTAHNYKHNMSIVIPNK